MDTPVSIAILGSGPAGLTAAIYAARAGLNPVVLEGVEPGGELLKSSHVANFPGFKGVVTGAEVIGAIRAQAEELGVEFRMDAVESVDFSQEGAFRLSTMMGETIVARSVVVATGAGVSKTGRPGEAKYFGRGISACLTCDGAFYKGRRVAIVGEGAAAAGARAYLTRCGAEVAAEVAVADLAEFLGDGKVLTGVSKTDGSSIPCDGAFLVTARRPQTQFLGNALALDGSGHVVVSETRTSVRGVFAAGDCARPKFKQAVVAASDGAIAAMEASSFLAGLRS
jgi:thioredoxin reductase (NADPH)